MIRGFECFKARESMRFRPTNHISRQKSPQPSFNIGKCPNRWTSIFVTSSTTAVSPPCLRHVCPLRPPFYFFLSFFLFLIRIDLNAARFTIPYTVFPALLPLFSYSRCSYLLKVSLVISETLSLFRKLYFFCHEVNTHIVMCFFRRSYTYIIVPNKFSLNKFE